MSRAVLVTGATGNQGGSVVDALFKANAGLEILALTRKKNSPRAQSLREKYPTIKLVEGDLSDVPGIFKNAMTVASQGIWGVFLVPVMVPTRSKHDVEEQQSKAVIDAAVQNNVKHFVYTSVDRGGDDSIHNPTDVPHFATKHNIEKYLLDKTQVSGMNYVILRPTCFFDNFTPGFAGKLVNTCWKVALKDKPLQLVAVSDIGFFGAQAFLHPEEYTARCISLAGDEITFEEMARIYKARTGEDIPMTFGFLAHLLMFMVKDVGNMYRWFYKNGYKADIHMLKKVYPELKDFGTWLEKDTKMIKKPF
ncbi:nmrA-like family protein [Aspergillus caelatus]|uniref:NmrA-like family protein n=1 Tax=Aspergillus caelatus TaxID=61420 RepID=A0A5N6ZWW8_9EURO|nr:nmrA-like family protein [Aspergillus caelatus]KAE8362111.1 nmrA-like family protein [Aspergillus caelatus]